LTVCNTSSFFTQSDQLIFSISLSLSSITFQNSPSISNQLLKPLKCQRHTKLCSKCSTLLIYSLQHKPSFLVKIFFCCLNAAFVMAILDLI
jgi:hypothetical protein